MWTWDDSLSPSGEFSSVMILDANRFHNWNGWCVRTKCNGAIWMLCVLSVKEALFCDIGRNFNFYKCRYRIITCVESSHILIAMLMGPTWGPPGTCRPQLGPMLAPWTLLSRYAYASKRTRCKFWEDILSRSTLTPFSTTQKQQNLP